MLARADAQKHFSNPRLPHIFLCSYAWSVLVTFRNVLGPVQDVLNTEYER